MAPTTKKRKPVTSRAFQKRRRKIRTSKTSVATPELQLNRSPQPQSETFQLFSKLPKELRMQIWATAADEQRIVIVDLSKPGKKRTSSPPPPILQVCAESREVGLKFYSLTFGSRRQPDRTYFNFERDILHLKPVIRGPHGSPRMPVTVAFGATRPSLFPNLDCNGEEQVQYLYYELNGRNDFAARLHWQILRVWPALKGVYVGSQPKPKLDLDRQVGFVPVPKKEYRSVSRELHSDRRCPFGPMLPELTLAGRVDWLRRTCVREALGQVLSLEEQERFERIRDGVTLIKLVNYDSLEGAG